jgi:hypothetical protein
MKKAVLMVVTLALVLSAFLFVAIPVHADSDRGDCRAANGGVHGTMLADYAQTSGGIRRGPDECGSLAPPL